MSLFFIASKNKDYKEISSLENKLYKKTQDELISYKENLVKIEHKKTGESNKQNNSYIEVSTIVIDSEASDINDIKKELDIH